MVAKNRLVILPEGLPMDVAVLFGFALLAVAEMVIKNGGLCLFASHPKSGEKIQIEPHDLISGKQIRGSWGGNSSPDRDIPLLAELYLKGKLPLEDFFSPAYSLNQINKALNDLEDRRINRGLIDFSL